MTSKINGIKQNFASIIKCDDYSDSPFIKRFLFTFLRISYAVIRDVREGQITLRAMSLVYTTVISIVPLLAISFSALKGFGMDSQIRPALDGMLVSLGDKRFEIIDKILGFVDNVQFGVLGSIGLALLIYSVISMMQKIESSFNFIWHIHKGRTFSQRFSDYLSVLFIAPILLILSVGITTSLQTNLVVGYLSDLPAMGELIRIIGLTIPYFIMGGAFAFIYFFIPNTKVSIKSAFIGGLVTAIIWKTMGVIFSAFIANSSSNIAIYSAFASIIILMVWLYIGWLVLLVGTAIAFYHQNPHNILSGRQDIRLSHRVAEKLGMALMCVISKGFLKNRPPLSADDLSDYFSLPIHTLRKRLDILESAGYLARTSDSPALYLPAKSPEKITVKEIRDVLRNDGEADPFDYADIKAAKNHEKLMAKVDGEINDKLSATTIASIC